MITFQTQEDFDRAVMKTIRERLTIKVSSNDEGEYLKYVEVALIEDNPPLDEIPSICEDSTDY